MAAPPDSLTVTSRTKTRPNTPGWSPSSTPSGTRSTPRSSSGPRQLLARNWSRRRAREAGPPTRRWRSPRRTWNGSVDGSPRSPPATTSPPAAARRPVQAVDRCRSRPGGLRGCGHRRPGRRPRAPPRPGPPQLPRPRRGCARPTQPDKGVPACGGTLLYRDRRRSAAGLGGADRGAGDRAAAWRSCCAKRCGCCRTCCGCCRGLAADRTLPRGVRVRLGAAAGLPGDPPSTWCPTSSR